MWRQSWRMDVPAAVASAVAAVGIACSGDGIAQRSVALPALPWSTGRAPVAEPHGGDEADGGTVDRRPAPPAPGRLYPDAVRRPQPPPLLVPVRGVDPAGIADNFGESRPGERRHDGIDIMAPRGSPVVSAATGWVLELSWNDLGGRTLYVLDASREYVLYYAHLAGYADGIEEGRPVRRGEVLGFVGDTGNARGWPQLHFQVGRLVAGPRRYWEHEPLDPYELLHRPPR